MQGSETWRELLAEMTREPQERDRIVRELNVNSITITRWVNNESTPRLDNLRRLLDVVPEQRKHLFDLLIRDFPDIALHVENDEPLYEVTSAFYARVFTTYVTTPANMRFWLLGKMVLKYLLEQLDPDLQHVAVLLVQCQQPSRGIVRSLRSVMGAGTPPWSGNLETQTILFGAESFVGQVLLSGHAALIENTEKYFGLLPISEYTFPGAQVLALNNQRLPQDFQIRRIASEMAAPVAHMDNSAGVLYVGSTRPGAFQQPHLQLLWACAVLMALAFAPGDFYPRRDIILHMMPLPWMQGPSLLQVPHRTLQLMRDMMNDPVPLDRTSAERIIWQQIEEELILLAIKTHQNGANEIR